MLEDPPSITIPLSLVFQMTSSIAPAEPPSELRFAGVLFRRAWVSEAGGVLFEFVEDGKTLDDWEHLLAYREHPGQDCAVVSQYLQQLRLPEQPAVYQYDDHENDIMLVFLIDPPDGIYTEFNIHRFVTEAGTVRSYQLAARNFQRELVDLSAQIKSYKMTWMTLIGEMTRQTFER